MASADAGVALHDEAPAVSEPLAKCRRLETASPTPAASLPSPSRAQLADGGAEVGAACSPRKEEEDEGEILRNLEESRRLEREKAQQKEEELKRIKEERLKEMFEDMDAKMRCWCRKLAEAKCVGEPWRNISEIKLKVLAAPSLDAQTFDGEYIPAGGTFGVEEVQQSSDRKWLRLVTGGWVSDYSRKPGRSSKQVAERANRHQEFGDEGAFQVRLDEDRRAAYLRMVHRRSETELRIPECLKVDLMPYQIEGLEWLVSLFNNDLSGLLADEMGLGKTIQTLALMAFLKETKKRYGPHLVICPKSVLANWKKEISRCYPEYEDNVIMFQGTPAERDSLATKIRKVLKKGKKKLIVVTNYEQVHPDKNQVLHEPKWELIVVDEGHRMKNQKTVFHQTMKECFKARMKLLLTGTPLQNSLDELFAMLNYLLPEIFSSAASFKSWFAQPVMQQLESLDMNEYFVDFTEEEERLLVANMHAMLAPFLLQRTKADVLTFEALPPRREEMIRVPLSAWQARTYEELRSRTLRRLDGEGAEVTNELLRNTTMQLRKIALHPYLFGRGTGVRSAEDVVRASGKMEALDRLLRKLHLTGHKVLIFSQFTSILDVLEELMALRSWNFERIDGQVAAEERQARIARFSDPEGASFVFLLSAKAGAVGLNLQAADTVVLFDLDWNPQNDKQAVARAHRIGQTKEVLVVRLLTLSPIEEHIERRASEKLELEKKIIGAGGFSKKGNTKTPEERSAQLQELLGSSTVGKTDSQGRRATTLAEMNTVLARSETERAAFAELDVALGLPDDREVEDALTRCGRLMAVDDIPEGFEAVDHDDDSE